MAGELLFDEKICQRAALFWFGLRDVGILYSRAVIQRTIDVQAQKKKKKKPRAVDVLFKAYPMIPLHADPIWPDSTFKVLCWIGIGDHKDRRWGKDF